MVAQEDEARLAAAVEAAFGDGYRTFVSGMAPGFDLAAAKAAVRLRDTGANLRFVAAIPFARQAAGYSADDRFMYEALVAAADEVRILEAGYTHGCYYRRDEWMVERSGRIIRRLCLIWQREQRHPLHRSPGCESRARSGQYFPRRRDVVLAARAAANLANAVKMSFRARLWADEGSTQYNACTNILF